MTATRSVSLSDEDRSVAFAGCQLTPGARALALEAMSSGWLTAGPRTVAFEHALAEWIGAPHAVAVSSCTAAIEIALRSMGLPQGAPVLTPTLTFAGAVHAILHAGLRPVFVDVDEQTLTVSPAGVSAAAAAAQPAAMVVQHMAGYPVAVGDVALAAGLPLDRIVEDAAHGLGAQAGKRAVGTTSDATCFSFYATKNLPIGEGGAITTADPDLADRFRVMRQHGMSRDAWRRYEPGAQWRYAVDSDGLKANFTDLQAAIGLGQLPHLNAWQERRAVLAERYDAHLGGVPGLTLPPRPDRGRHAWHLYVVRIVRDFGIGRDELISRLSDKGIGTSVHFIPVHQFGYFRSVLGEQHLPVADRLAGELLSLPLYPHLSEIDVDYVCAQLLAARGVGRR
jgi:perosamine synthetase